MNQSIPQSSHFPGWPEFITDTAGARYVRLRDGKPVTEFHGVVAIYGLLDDENYIDRAHQWIPLQGSTEDDMRLTGGTWDEPEVFIRFGQTPIEVPEEPVEWPA